MSFEVDSILERLLSNELPKEAEVTALCAKVKEIMSAEDNVKRISSPVTVCGDIHGQFDDLLELFKVGGECPYVNYLFLGDYVDRGMKGVETMLYLFALKVKYPERMTLIRGNHEGRNTTQMYGFFDECTRKFGTKNVWKEVTDAFDCMTISALIDGKVFCVHGGLSPKIKQIDEIQQIERQKEIPHIGPMCDLMWSDPDEVKTWSYSQRGAGWLFGKEIVDKFNHENGLTLIARAHQIAFEGYKLMFNDKLVTVWSAPNYGGKGGNLAAVMEIDENMQTIYKVYEETPFDECQSNAIFKQVPQYIV